MTKSVVLKKNTQMDKVPKFYLNPNTGRLIKSNGKTYKQLKKDGYIIKKDKCLYNVKSAEKCFIKLLTLYPNVIYPSSNFIEIPKTYKKGKIRAFIKHAHKNKIIGFIDKNGKKYRLLKQELNKIKLQKEILERRLKKYENNNTRTTRNWKNNNVVKLGR